MKPIVDVNGDPRYKMFCFVINIKNDKILRKKKATDYNLDSFWILKFHDQTKTSNAINLRTLRTCCGFLLNAIR